MMNKWCPVIFACAATLVCAWGETASQEMTPEEVSHEKARMIAGISNGSACGPAIQVDTWKPLNDADREYCGPVDVYRRVHSGAAPGNAVITSFESLLGVVRDMAAAFCAEKEVTLNGVKMDDWQKWLKVVNTCPYGNISFSRKGNALVLQASYSPAHRILTAFCYPSAVKQLSDREKKCLEVCVNWICANITVEMPSGLKLKKVHDALIDCSSSSVDHHDAMDVLLDGVGSSQAYASASQLLLSMLRFDCRLVKGRMLKNHCWNMVKLDKNWFHLDIDLDDSLRRTHGRRYDYCLLTDEEISTDHTWERKGIYPATPEIARARFFLRNELRRAWRYEATEHKTQKTPSRLARVPEQQKLITRAGLKKFPARKETDDTGYQCATAGDVNQILEDRLRQLDDSDIRITWNKGTPEWRMRQMLAQSALPEVAEKYCLVYDEAKGCVVIHFSFWTHRRVLAAAETPLLMDKLSDAEKEAARQCCRMAARYGSAWKSKRQKVKDVYMAHVMPNDGRITDSSRTGLSAALSYAQSMYVVCRLMGIPCHVVHGRTSEEYHTWNLVCLGENKWYHLDATLDARAGYASEHLCRYLLLADNKMKKTHAWDASEFDE